jgi:dTDP-4-dehydrorhamnose 3,5-epimerase
MGEKMIFTATKLGNAYVIELEKKYDIRGFFARIWCQKEFAAHDLISHLVQVNISYNKKMGTLRGMHYQMEPFQESKLVRCTRGAIYDVIIDLRENSPTYQQWLGIELTADNYKMLYVPEGFAHGFETLEDNTEVSYQVSEFYAPQSEGGVRYNDPTFGIVWPLDAQVISDKDRNWPDYQG